MGSLWYCNVGHGRAEIAHAVSGNPQRRLIVSRRPSYHGVTYGGMAATGLPPNQEHFGPMLPDVVQVPHDDLAAAEALFAERGDEVAAVLAEPVIGAGGVHPPVPGYLEGLRALCDEHGAYLVLDEVICAFGRLGTWWGAERYGVRPDLATFAKAVTSGYLPLGGVVVGGAVRAALESAPDLVLRHGHTYSGHPSACAAGVAALGITRREGLLDRALKIGERLSAGLRSLAEDGHVAGVRGDGAIWAAQLHDDLSAPAVRDGMLERGVIPRPIGTSTIAFCPPLVISDAEVDQCVTALEEAVVAARRQRS
jgi:adenosylmethionine-8-amino-7-oxononanoate aminotransferase